MKSFPSPWKGVRSLIKKYPDDKNKIMESLICCSDEELKNCIDMTNFCLGLYGKSATNIIGRRPIDCFVKIYRDCSDDQRDRLVDKILSNTDLFSFVFSNADVLLDIINPGFTYTATLTNMDNISKYKDKIIKKYMSSIFNAYKLDEKIDEILIEGFRHNKFKEIINCCTNEQKNKVFVRLISTPTVFCRLIRNSEDLEKISNDFSEYALIFKLNFELRKAIESDIDGEVSEAFKCLSSIQEAIKSAFTNGTIKYESLQLFSSFLSFFAILPEQVVPGELTKKLAELYNYLSTIKIPSLAELCVDSLVQGGLYSAKPGLELVSLENYEDVQKMFDIKKTELTSRNNIIIVKLSETEEFFIIGVNNSGECVDGVLDNDSDLGKALIENNETSIEKISQERKNVIFEKAKDYLGTNIELVNPRAKIAFEGIVQEEKIEFKK